MLQVQEMGSAAAGYAEKLAQAEMFQTIGTMVVNITLFSVLIYELVGPFLTKMVLQKAGEIRPEEKTSARGKKDVMGH